MRLQTARLPPAYPISSPDHRTCISLTPSRSPHAVHPCPSVDSGLDRGAIDRRQPVDLPFRNVEASIHHSERTKYHLCEHSQRRLGRRESPIRSAWRRTQVPERGCSCQSPFGPKSVAWPSSSPEVGSDYGASTHAEPGVSSFGHLADGGADDRVPVAVCLRRASALPRVSGVSLISLAAVVPLAILALVGRQSMGQQVLSVLAWAIGGTAVTLVATVVYSVVVMTLLLDMIPIAEAPLWGSTSWSMRTDPPDSVGHRGRCRSEVA